MKAYHERCSEEVFNKSMAFLGHSARVAMEGKRLTAGGWVAKLIAEDIDFFFSFPRLHVANIRFRSAPGKVRLAHLREEWQRQSRQRQCLVVIAGADTLYSIDDYWFHAVCFCRDGNSVHVIDPWVEYIENSECISATLHLRPAEILLNDPAICAIVFP